MILDEYLQGDLTPSRLRPTWVTGSHFVFQSDDGGLAVLDTANDSISSLVTNHTLVRTRRDMEDSWMDKLIPSSLLPFQRQLNVK